MLFERVAILGVGLIGGSFALALKEAGACAHVAGAGRNSANLKLALERGVIDSIAADAVAAAHGADLVLLAAPRSEEHTSELQSHVNLVCRLLLVKKKNGGASFASSFAVRPKVKGPALAAAKLFRAPGSYGRYPI